MEEKKNLAFFTPKFDKSAFEEERVETELEKDLKLNERNVRKQTQSRTKADREKILAFLLKG